MKHLIISILFFGVFGATSAQAAVIHDESVDGDLSSVANLPSLLGLGLGANQVIGQVGNLQNTPDDPADLAKIPTLTLADLPRQNKSIPIERGSIEGVPAFTHPLATNGVLYVDFAFDMKALPRTLLPLVPLFSRALSHPRESINCMCRCPARLES